MIDKIRVRCRYYSCNKVPKGTEHHNYWCTQDDKNIDCAELFGQVTCNKPFELDWVKFILVKRHVYEDSL